MQNTILERSILCVQKKEAMKNHKIIKFYKLEGDGGTNIYFER